MSTAALPILLGLATLLPLASFFLILLLGRRLGGAAGHGAYVAIGAIGGACVLSFISLAIWLTNHFPAAAHHEPVAKAAAAHEAEPASGHFSTEIEKARRIEDKLLGPEAQAEPEHASPAHETTGHADEGPKYYTGDYYTLGVFGKLRLTISYYIDSLTICMFCMVTLIATCIHFYASGYMHEELHSVTDHEVKLRDGTHLTRPGRYCRFFQYLSLFSFSMLGLVLSGNIAMVFVFWELVGICSYFLIGFYVERKSASNAANKAFITNRVGDFGMIIGLMALWTSLGTFSFGDLPKLDAAGNPVAGAKDPGIFRLVRSGKDHALRTPDGMVRMSARSEIEERIRELGPAATPQQVEFLVANLPLDDWRNGGPDGTGPHYGYWLLIVAGVGIFCGCVGKSAQFPLHVWLPDAMEGPTPVSALVHSATMVAAGVYLVGRFYPVFAPEVLLVIACTGCITLFIAATIAITATDIKRVLAYSTVSQLGYMMLALGVGGWVAGLLHLITHAFFKSLLFLCSGSVIHAVHTNEMTEMGGLRKKMPVTAFTMLIGCLAIAGISLPFVIGFSGYYSKDRILEQAYAFKGANGSFLGSLFFYAAAGGAAITAFYMFRLWYMTFAGKPRNHHRYEHAHESPKVMYVPLLILAFFATTVAWTPPQLLGRFHDLSLVNLLEQSRPAGTLTDAHAVLLPLVWPDEHFAHKDAQYATIVVPVTLLATFTALAGIALATVMYWLGYLSPGEVRKQFESIYQFLLHKWWFDELYELIFIRPTHAVAGLAARIDQRWIDRFLDGLARSTSWFAVIWDRFADQMIVDGSVNLAAKWTFGLGTWLRIFQTGRLRQYVMFIVIAAIAVFVLISFFWSPTFAG